MVSSGCFWIVLDGSLPILASIFLMNKTTDPRLVAFERSLSVDHFSSLIFENSLKIDSVTLFQRWQLP